EAKKSSAAFSDTVTRDLAEQKKLLEALTKTQDERASAGQASLDELAESIDEQQSLIVKLQEQYEKLIEATTQSSESGNTIKNAELMASLVSQGKLLKELHARQSAEEQTSVDDKLGKFAKAIETQEGMLTAIRAGQSGDDSDDERFQSMNERLNDISESASKQKEVLESIRAGQAEDRERLDKVAGTTVAVDNMNESLATQQELIQSVLAELNHLKKQSAEKDRRIQKLVESQSVVVDSLRSLDRQLSDASQAGDRIKDSDASEPETLRVMFERIRKKAEKLNTSEQEKE
ncbi:MAG: hypothetical protein AAF497_28405, partial [Planctomycetota bacterium]